MLANWPSQHLGRLEPSRRPVRVAIEVAHFIDTFVLDEIPLRHHGPVVVGFQALTSPRGDPRNQPDPELLLGSLAGLDAGSFVIQDQEQLVRVLTWVIVNPPLARRDDRFLEFDEPREPPFPPELVEWVRAAIRSPLIAVEESPLSKRSIGELSATATTTALYFFNLVPVVAFLGVPFGLVLLRGIQELSGTLWEGARPEVAAFGRDLARHHLNLMRNRLGISREDDDA
mgnify:CR=1 FL=1